MANFIDNIIIILKKNILTRLYILQRDHLFSLEPLMKPRRNVAINGNKHNGEQVSQSRYIDSEIGTDSDQSRSSEITQIT